MNSKVFKYNMILYYQLLAVYLTSLVVYVLLRLQFTGFKIEKVLHDSIFYLFAVLFCYVLLATIYQLFKRKKIVIQDDRIIISTRSKNIEIPFNQIESIRIKREHKFHLSGFLRIVKIKAKDGIKRTIVIRPFDYENDDDLLRELIMMRNSIQSRKEGKNA